MPEHAILEVTDEDVGRLDDVDLRSLVARLAEATLRHSGLPSAAVTWGGDQNAPDGGLDIRVSLLPGTSLAGGFIPRPSTGYQVKRPDMPRRAILDEMRPDGALRPVLAELAAAGAAYVIVSSGSSVSDSALRRRRDAMREALSDDLNGHSLTVDFFDRQRLASWLRDHPALVPWVRAKAGRPIQGWQSFGDWSHAGLARDFVEDGQVRMHEGGTARGHEAQIGLSILDGLDRVRAALSGGSRVVRLVGLSGVGKTRFAEALFDDRFGTIPLPASQALYTDLGHHPEPAPIAMATHLLHSGVPAVLVVDNCPPDVHAQLAGLIRTVGKAVSVLTIEYDIRDDQPEGTNVFRMGAGSPGLVAKLVLARFPSISPVDAETVGRFSDGNPRVGMALVNSLRQGDSVAGLSHEALFQRLFRQRHDDSPGLLAAAEACALVYSFNAEPMAGEEVELMQLAELAGCSVRELHAHAAELGRRGLLQTRGRWRAILPHAIANRLASRALDNLPAEDVQQQLVTLASGRLLQSFSRRLGYLHQSSKAVRIAEAWLTGTGMLADVAGLNRLGIAILRNVAPASPSATLAALTRAGQGGSANHFFSTENQHRGDYTRLLRQLAYDPALFDGSTSLLACFAEAEEDHRGDGVLNMFRSLFSPFLSGTMASVEQRMTQVEVLLRSSSIKRCKLGIAALSAALETTHFSSIQDFDFGALSRDYGLEPRTAAEQLRWFSAPVRLAIEFGASQDAVAGGVRKALARALPGLWMRTATQALIEEAGRRFSAVAFWEDGWVAVREALSRSAGSNDPALRARLEQLERTLAPTTLFQEVQVHVLRDQEFVLEAEDTPDAVLRAVQRADVHAEKLGEQVASEPRLLRSLVPLLLAEGVGRRFQFGRGLARAAPDRGAAWQDFIEALESVEPFPNTCVLIGFLQWWKAVDPSGVEAALDDAVFRPGLAEVFPHLQASTGLGGNAVERLHSCLQYGRAPVHVFRTLGYGGVTVGMPTLDLRRFLEALATSPSGLGVCIEILAMRFHSGFDDDGQNIELASLARDLLGRIDPASVECRRLDFNLSTLALACLAGPEGGAASAKLCTTIARVIVEDRVSPNVFHHLLPALFKVQPVAALHAFFGDGVAAMDRIRVSLMFNQDMDFQRHPLAEVADDKVLAWCEGDGMINYIAAASIVPMKMATGEGSVAWTSIALKILRDAPDRCAVLRQFVSRLWPHCWSGSRAVLLATNAAFLANVESFDDPEVVLLAGTESERLLEESRTTLALENDRSRLTEEQFE